VDSGPGTAPTTELHQAYAVLPLQLLTVLTAQMQGRSHLHGGAAAGGGGAGPQPPEVLLLQQHPLVDAIVVAHAAPLPVHVHHLTLR